MLSTLFWGDSSAKNLSGDSDAIQTVSVKKITTRRPAHRRLVFLPVSPRIKCPPPAFCFFSYKYYHETAVCANYRGFFPESADETGLCKGGVGSAVEKIIPSEFINHDQT
jgi:hypothetical protein